MAGAASAQLTPEQAFDLYARTLLEDDAAATRTLNDALKPAFEGQDAVTPTPAHWPRPWPNRGRPCWPAPVTRPALRPLKRCTPRPARFKVPRDQERGRRQRIR